MDSPGEVGLLFGLGEPTTTAELLSAFMEPFVHHCNKRTSFTVHAHATLALVGACYRELL